MATFVQTATRWAREQAVRMGRPVAIQFNNTTMGACSAASDMNPAGHGMGTAAVNLMQLNPAAGGWLALSYPPTAACIGMALLLGFKRIVWNDGADRGLKISRDAVLPETGEAARVQQSDKTNYADDHASAARFVFPALAQRPLANFVPPGGIADLIQDIPGDDEVRDGIAMRLAFAIVALTFGPNSLNAARGAAYQGQNIGSVLVDNTYRILAWGLNTNTANATFHGEMNLINAYQMATAGASLPAGSRLFSTLEPCAMCSGMITHTASAGAISVVSAQQDPHLSYTALRAGLLLDGCSGQARRVHHEYSRAPFHAAKSTFHNGLTATDTRRYLEQTQIQVSGGPRPMQTTRFLEQHAGEAMLDHIRILLMQAAVWLPANQRAAWRAKLSAFARHVVRATS